MKWRILIATSLLILDEGSCRSPRRPRVDPECECGLSENEVATRIVGGRTAIPHIFPWVVAVFHKGSLHCGGALINNRYILTAGHCVKWIENHRELSVGLGMHDIENFEEGQRVAIDRAILHEDFESDYMHDINDIALLKLKHPVRYTGNIQPVCLPSKASNHSGHEVKVSGWGRVKTGGGASTLLREATLRVMPHAQCRNTSIGEHITDEVICAYDDGKDACQGDSGGPLLFERDNEKYEVAGVVSWGIGCAKPGMPGVYVKVTDYLDWIMRHTRDAVYCVDN